MATSLSGEAAATRCLQLAVSIGDQCAEAFYLGLIAYAESQQGRLSTARMRWQRVADLYVNLAKLNPGVYVPDWAGSLNNLGFVLEQLYDFTAALECYASALRIYEQFPREDVIFHVDDIAGALNNLGVLLRFIGQGEAAYQRHSQAGKLLRDLGSECPYDCRPQIASTFNNLGINLTDLGLPDQAEKALGNALTMYGRVAAESPQLDVQFELATAACRMNLARVYLRTRRSKRAAREIRRALRTYRQLMPILPHVVMPRAAHAATALGKALARHSQTGAAAKACRLAVQWFRQVNSASPGSGELEFIWALSNLGNVLERQGRVTAAGAKYREAVERANGLGRWSPRFGLSTRIAAYRNLAQHDLARFESKRDPRLLHRAQQLLSQAAEAGEMQRAAFRLRWQRERVHAQLGHVYELLVQAGVEAWLLSPDSDQPLGEAFAAAEAGRAKTIAELLADETLSPRNVPTEDAVRFHELRRRVRQRMVTAQQVARKVSLDDLTPKTGDVSSERATAFAALQSRADAELQEYGAALRQIQVYDPTFDPEEPVAPASAAQVASFLPDADTAAVQFTLTPRLSVAIVVTKSGTSVVRLPGEAEQTIRTATRDWLARYTALRDQDDRAAARDQLHIQLEESLAVVNELAIKPLVESLPAHIRSLIIAPHKGLHAFPLHACCVSGEQVLADRFNVTFASSFSVLARCGARCQTPSEGAMLVEGDAGDLWFRALETQCVERRFAGNVDRPRGSSNTELAAAALSTGRRVWHFSGHCDFDPQSPLMSGLELGPSRLTLREVFQSLRLRGTELVVLSGCESGMLRPHRLDEYVSFPTAFLYAGAKCVLSTLWEADDLATTLLIDRFYNVWQAGEPIGAALRQAQAWLRGSTTCTESLRSGADLRAYLKERQLFDGLSDEGTRNTCQAIAEFVATNSGQSPPFHSPVDWAPFVATGVGW